MGVIATSPLTVHANPARPSEDLFESDSPTEDDPGDRPEPFVESAPLLVEVRTLLSERAPSKRSLKAGLAVLEDWLRAPHDDELAVATGEWLRARLLSRLGHEDATSAWEALAVTPGAFSDEARAVLADLHRKARGTRGAAVAAHWSLTRSPWAVAYVDDARKAVSELSKRHEQGRAIELLEQTLFRGMSRKTRGEVVLMLADLHVGAGQRERAIDLLLQSFWSSERPDPRWLRLLDRLEVEPDSKVRSFHEALYASRTDAVRADKGHARSEDELGTATAALLERWDDDRARSALARLEALGTEAEESSDRVYVELARGILLRKVDEDARAIEAFEAAITASPEHPLAHIARSHAATLLRAASRHDEARPLDERILETGIPGDLHRAALWRLGFGAILQKRPEEAEVHLRELERRHGGEAEVHSVCWFERARYWRARAAQLANVDETAKSFYASVIDRFPAGWYALLARRRLELPPSQLEPAVASPWDLDRDDPMATAVALYRLGEEELARRHFEALLNEEQLPGHGRLLLADLLELSGDESRAARVLKHDLIPPSMPGEDLATTYFDWYPLRFEEALESAARANGLPSSLLAGLVSVESRFNASARSHAGAIGAAQLLKSTGTAVGRRVFGKGFDASRLTDPDVNLAVAARYLTDLLDSFKGHTALAVAAYNAGPANVRRWLSERPNLELDAFVETIPFEQARRYVMRVLSDAEIYRRLYGLDGHPVPISLSLDHSARR